jgi:hypothetical protein
MLRYLPNLRLLRGGRLRAGAVGEEPLHQAALHLAGGGDEVVLGGDGLLDGAQHVGDAALFGEGRESNRYALQPGETDTGLVDVPATDTAIEPIVPVLMKVPRQIERINGVIIENTNNRPYSQLASER